ncbi:MAG: M1 family metallopeptidase, partial [Bacteroidia bacterium]
MTCSLFAQHQNQDDEQYFQQEVNYKINVKLNDATHELSASEEIVYVNNSSTDLTFIYFHLWPNAYKNQNTALAKQLLENGETSFYFSKPEERGYIDSLDFKVNGAAVKVEADPQYIDICKLILNEPLKKGASVTITTPFHVKLPSAKFSRLGHDGQAYYITQWYPKPAVYDLQGWHQMPYLNQGEFYSEFGSFDVSITVPKNYLLAATGDRIDAAEEEQWLNGKVKETEELIRDKKLYDHRSPFPASSAETKTIRFKQSRVHDFAWFADKRFHVLKDRINLINSPRQVDTWIFFTDNEASLWKDALEYVNDATLFYSFQNGDYPYNHVTAIDGTIAAGGGMEYPNITIIGESREKFILETTIVHEVGHNWFYGILGTNERQFPAMDEGINSFYEMRYIQGKYPEKKLTDLLGRDSTFKLFGLNKFRQKAYYKLSYLLAARKNTDQPINLPADRFTDYNYGAIVYCKTAIVFDYLMNSVGSEKFDEAMHFYFEHWKFKHPTPQNLMNTLEYYCSTKLDWFLNDLVLSNKKLDYKITGSKKLATGGYEVTVKNKGDVLGPVVVSGLNGDKIVGDVWYNGFTGKKTIEFPPATIDRFKIDAYNIMPDVRANNNTIKTKGLFKKLEPLQINLLGKLDDPDRTQLNVLPIMGYNMYNKYMLGLAVYNYSLLQKRFEYTLAPMYAFGSNTAVGFADFTFHITPDKLFQQVDLGLKYKSFAFDYANPKNYYPGETRKQSFSYNYDKFEPFVKFNFKKKDPRSLIDQSLLIRNVTLRQDNDVSYTDSLPLKSPKVKSAWTYINELVYTFSNNRAINPFGFRLNLQQNNDFAKLSLTANYSITFQKGHSLDFRLFGGTFLGGSNKGLYRFRASGYNGYQDYMYDYNFIGRNEYNGLPFAQFAEEDGALKVWTPLGQSDTWLAGMNIKSPKFFKLPVKLFADVVVCDGQFLNNDKVLYDA